MELMLYKQNLKLYLSDLILAILSSKRNALMPETIQILFFFERTLKQELSQLKTVASCPPESQGKS
jgi:hypothetical protein